MYLWNMRLHLLLIVCLISGLSFCQNRSTSIGYKLSPGISSYHYEYFPWWENCRLSIQTGIEVEHQINSFLSLETGLYFIDRGPGFTMTTTDNQGNPIGEQSVKDHFLFLEVPLVVDFTLKNFYIGAGIGLNYYVLHRLYLDGELFGVDRTHFDDINYSWQSHIGYNLKLAKKWNLETELSYNKQIGTAYFNFGVGVGLEYEIKY